MWTNAALLVVGLAAVAVGVVGLLELTSGDVSSAAVLGTVVGVFGLLALAAVAVALVSGRSDRS
ncbi:MAG: hypothetical protein ACR2N6_00645 [Miltoncostaeaceae bacterium]